MIDNERKWRYNNNNKNEMIHERSGESADRRALAMDLADCDGIRISESTVRRDLAVLDEQGRIQKVRGGAMVVVDAYSTK